MAFAENFNLVLGTLVVIGQIFIVALAVCFLSGQGKKITGFFSANAPVIMLVVALTATLGSLTYSDIIGYEPCKLCWIQRIFMYPQVVLLAIALYKKERLIVDYILGLSVIGAVIALYHYLLQIGIAPALPCGAVGYSVSCSQRFVMEWGYITIPMMSLTAFLLIIVSALLATAQKKN